MVRHIKGHKNSKGEKAEWVIVSHKTGKVLSSHKSKSAAKEHLQQMHIFKEGVEEDGPSAYDIARMDTGKKPYWAKKVTEIGPRKLPVRGSSDPVEVAMRRVTGSRWEPKKESELSIEKQWRLKSLTTFMDFISKKLGVDYDIDDGKGMLEYNGHKFMVEFEDASWYVTKMHDRGLSKLLDPEGWKSKRCNSISDTVEFIKSFDVNESYIIGERMRRMSFREWYEAIADAISDEGMDEGMLSDAMEDREMTSILCDLYDEGVDPMEAATEVVIWHERKYGMSESYIHECGCKNCKAKESKAQRAMRVAETENGRMFAARRIPDKKKMLRVKHKKPLFNYE